MGKSKKSNKQNINQNIDQKPLKDGSLTAYTLGEETKATETVITWVIRNYSELNDSVVYYVQSEKYKRIWYLSVAKLPLELHARVGTNVPVDNLVLFFLRNDGKILDSTLSRESMCLYNGILDKRQISNPSGCLIDDILIIQCTYTARPCENNIFLTPGIQVCNELKSISDEDILVNDLKELYLSGLLSDLTLIVGPKEFRVHKLILRKQSKYFEWRLTEHPDWSGKDFGIIASPIAMNDVLYYIYSGEMRNMQLESMSEVYSIASILEIESLQTICVHYFKSMFSIDNVLEFLKLALNCKHIAFQKEVMDFLKKQPESVRQREVWADVIRQASNLMEDVKKNKASHNT